MATTTAPPTATSHEPRHREPPLVDEDEELRLWGGKTGDREWQEWVQVLARRRDCLYSARQALESGSFRVSPPIRGCVAFRMENLMLPSECRALIDLATRQGLEPVDWEYRPSYRQCQRAVFRAPILADLLWARIAPHLTKEEVFGVKPYGIGTSGIWRPVGLNDCVRVTVAAPGDHFALHRDGGYARTDNLRSVLSLVVWLDVGYRGGDTVFFHTENGAPHAGPEAYRFRAEAAGDALVFTQDVWHQGMPVTAGRKVLARFDVMYERVGAERALTIDLLSEDDRNALHNAERLYLESVRLQREGDAEGSTCCYLKAQAVHAERSGSLTRNAFGYERSKSKQEKEEEERQKLQVQAAREANAHNPAATLLPRMLDTIAARLVFEVEDLLLLEAAKREKEKGEDGEDGEEEADGEEEEDGEDAAASDATRSSAAKEDADGGEVQGRRRPRWELVEEVCATRLLPMALTCKAWRAALMGPMSSLWPVLYRARWPQGPPRPIPRALWEHAFRERDAAERVAPVLWLVVGRDRIYYGLRGEVAPGWNFRIERCREDPMEAGWGPAAREASAKRSAKRSISRAQKELDEARQSSDPSASRREQYAQRSLRRAQDELECIAKSKQVREVLLRDLFALEQKSSSSTTEEKEKKSDAGDEHPLERFVLGHLALTDEPLLYDDTLRAKFGIPPEIRDVMRGMASTTSGVHGRSHHSSARDEPGVSGSGATELGLARSIEHVYGECHGHYWSFQSPHCHVYLGKGRYEHFLDDGALSDEEEFEDEDEEHDGRGRLIDRRTGRIHPERAQNAAGWIADFGFPDLGPVDIGSLSICVVPGIDVQLPSASDWAIPLEPEPGDEQQQRRRGRGRFFRERHNGGVATLCDAWASGAASLDQLRALVVGGGLDPEKAEDDEAVARQVHTLLADVTTRRVLSSTGPCFGSSSSLGPHRKTDTTARQPRRVRRRTAGQFFETVWVQTRHVTEAAAAEAKARSAADASTATAAAAGGPGGEQTDSSDSDSDDIDGESRKIANRWAGTQTFLAWDKLVSATTVEEFVRRNPQAAQFLKDDFYS